MTFCNGLIFFISFSISIITFSYCCWHERDARAIGELPDDNSSFSFDVGVDCHNYSPINYEEIKNIMKTKQWTNPIVKRS